MLWLQSGDRFPTVALVQESLGFAARQIDGVYGPATKRRVIDFQRSENGLMHDGVVGPQTWKRLTKNRRRPIVDIVDVNDDGVQHVHDKLVSLGSHPHNPPFLSNAIRLIANIVQARRRKEGPIDLLRIYSHGSPGHQNVSRGLGGHWITPKNPCRVGSVKNLGTRQACIYPSDGGQSLKWEGFEQTKRFLAPIRGCFSPLGSIELHGCVIGGAVTSNGMVDRVGQKFLFSLALFLGVPVTAATDRNKVRNIKEVLRVERPYSSWFPWAGELSDWARQSAMKMPPPKAV